MRQKRGGEKIWFPSLNSSLLFVENRTRRRFVDGVSSRIEKALWYMDEPNETILSLKTNISTKYRANKIGVNSESVLKTGHLSKTSDPLTFQFSGKVRRQLLNLSFLCLKLYYNSYKSICLSKGNEWF